MLDRLARFSKQIEDLFLPFRHPGHIFFQRGELASFGSSRFEEQQVRQLLTPVPILIDAFLEKNSQLLVEL